MPLTPGTRLGSYEILGPLGAGGMGEVFRARDSRLGRDVAVKVLPAAFAQNPERLARFEREARLLASLNHANIAGIHGLEVIEGHRHLILEFVDGETLSARLARGPLPIDEALSVGAQIAAALDAAHEAGIVHRDLKPGNVMLTVSGDVKVLDFGLARGADTTSSDPNLSASPTFAATMAGVILGTAAYMSPEQARGKAVDRRTDIRSFGCVLYECLTGRQPYGGETVSDTIGKILEREPDWNALPVRTPTRVQELLRRCLEKDSKKRQRDAGDIRLELEGVLAAASSSSGILQSQQVAARPKVMSWIPWAIAAVSSLAAILMVILPRLGKEPAPTPIRALITLPHNSRLIDHEGCQIAISPDGKWIALAAADSLGQFGIWLRAVDQLEARQIVQFGSGPGLPFWSPDSRRIGFFADGKLKSIAQDGNPPQTICDAPDGRGGTWNKEGTILFTPTSTGPIHRVKASGGKSEPILDLDAAAGETTQRFPRFLSDGRYFTFASLPAQNDEVGTWVGRLDSNERHLLGSATAGTLVVTADAVVFRRALNLMAHRWDGKNRRLVGEPGVIGIVSGRARVSGGPPVAHSAAGILVYPNPAPTTQYLAWFSRDDGHVVRLAVPAASWMAAHLSPDGQRAAALRLDAEGNPRLWMVDSGRGTAIPLGNDEGIFGPICWSPDGRELFYGRRRAGRQELFARGSSGGGAERLVYESENLFKAPYGLSPDGNHLLFRQLDSGTLRDIWYVPTGGGEAKSLVAGPGEEWGASFSPDGKWVAYISEESGRPELYVTRFPSGDGKLQITTDGAGSPFWVRNTWEILYSTPTGAMMSIAVRPGTSFEFEEPVAVSKLSEPPRGFRIGSISPDGRRFLGSQAEEDTQEPTLTILTNWNGLLEPW